MPVDGELMLAAAELRGFALVLHEQGHESPINHITRLMRETGITEQAVEMFARSQINREEAA